MITRRSLITHLATFVAAPAIVRVGSIMPVKGWAEGPRFPFGLRPVGILYFDHIAQIAWMRDDAMLPWRRVTGIDNLDWLGMERPHG